MGSLSRAHACALIAMAIGAFAWPRAAGAETLRIGTIAPDGSVYMRDLRAMASEVDHLSGGALKIKYYTAGRMGDDADMARELLSTDGRIDGAGLTTVGLSMLVPEIRVWEFPGLFRSWDEVDFVRHEQGAHFDKLFHDHGLELLFWGDVGFAQLFCDTPIASLAELRKHTMWTWKDDDGQVQAASLLGIKTWPSGLAQLMDALQGGKVDAWFFVPLAMVAFGLHPYAKTMSDLKWVFQTGAFVIKKDAYDALPEEQQRVLKAVASKWQPRLERSWQAENDRARGALIKQGVKVVPVSDRDAQIFFQEAAGQADALAKHYGLEPELRAVSDSLATFRATRRKS